jgi:hypothetical protein
MDDRDAADRAAYEATGNPLHVWAAIGRYAADEPLPAWVRRYLLQCVRELIRLQLNTAISPTEAAKRTARALGLVSHGRNCFANMRQLREDSLVNMLYTLGPGPGETEAWAVDLAEATGTTPRSIRRRVAKARRAWPE